MMSISRFLIAGIIINGLLNFIVLNFIVDSRIVPMITAFWMAIGYVRIFGRNMRAETFQMAFKGVIMSLVWPLVHVRK